MTFYATHSVFCEVTCLGKPESLEEEKLETHSEAVIYGSVDELHHGFAQWSRILGVSNIYTQWWERPAGDQSEMKTSQQDTVREFVITYFKPNESLTLKVFHKMFMTLYEQTWMPTFLAVASRRDT